MEQGFSEGVLMPGWRGTMALISPPLEWPRKSFGDLSIYSLLGAIRVSSFLWVSDMVSGSIMVEGGSLEKRMVNPRLQVQEREFQAEVTASEKDWRPGLS